MGGPDAEREVSLSSGAEIARALSERHSFDVAQLVIEKPSLAERLTTLLISIPVGGETLPPLFPRAKKYEKHLNSNRFKIYVAAGITIGFRFALCSILSARFSLQGRPLSPTKYRIAGVRPDFSKCLVFTCCAKLCVTVLVTGLVCMIYDRVRWLGVHLVGGDVGQAAC